MVRPAMGRRVDAFLRQMAERAGGEYTESDAVRALLQAALDGLKVQDPG
jgi:flavin-dependent dehydrogenase